MYSEEVWGASLEITLGKGFAFNNYWRCVSVALKILCFQII